MVWAGIIGNQVVGLFLVPDGLKINSVNYCLLNSLSDDVRKSIIFHQDKAPSHASCFTKSWLAYLGITGKRLMDWPPQSPDLIPIENLWSIIKRKVYKNGRQFGSKKDLWETVKDVSAKIQLGIIQKFTNLIDDRLVELLKIGETNFKLNK